MKINSILKLPNFTKRKQLISAFIVFSYILIVGYLISIGIKYAPDSKGYLEMHPIRTPLYPLIIKLLQLAGGHYFHLLTLVFQIGIGITAVYIFSSYWMQTFNLPIWITFLISLVCFAPYIISENGNYILSEAIAYPLFLIAMRYFFSALLSKKFNHFYIYLLFLLLLILTRSQFLFLYPLSFLALIYLFYNAKNEKIAIIKLFVAFIFCIILTNVFERSYFYFKYHKFKTIPFTGIQIATPAFYLTKANDIKLFTDSTEIKYFSDVYKIISDNNWTWNYNTKLNGNKGMSYYGSVYNKICHGAIEPIAEVLYKKIINDNTMDGYIAIDQLTSKIALKIINANKMRYFKLYTMNLIEGIGGKHYTVFFLILFLLSFLIFCKTKNIYALFTFSVCCINISNVALIAILEPTNLYRYTIYNDALFSTLLIIISFRAINQIKYD